MLEQNQETGMQLRQALLGVSNDARGWLRTWASDFEETEARERGSGSGNPIAWQLGHIACTEDDVVRLFGGASTVPTALRSACGTGCPPPGPDTVYPSLDQLWQLLDDTHRHLVQLVEQASDSDFDRPPVTENPYFHTLGQAVYEIALHETYHVGEIATLRKAIGKERIG
jgi:DinB superfamily